MSDETVASVTTLPQPKKHMNLRRAGRVATVVVIAAAVAAVVGFAVKGGAADDDTDVETESTDEMSEE